MTRFLRFNRWRHHRARGSKEVNEFLTQTIQELLGQSDLTTTMFYTHVLKRGPLGVITPADHL
jgi:site-specific recombinase XerC